MDHRPQLDGLRVFAVLGVLLAHYWGLDRLPWGLGQVDWAHLGVRLFFVLSGFLITGILLDCRERTEAGPANRWFYIRRFYARRFLRIFPIYYLAIGLACAANLPPVRDIWVWLVTYSSNIYIAVHGDWIGRIGHFWTLAVEEQFYLVWPWLLLLVRRKWLLPVLLILVSAGPLYRWYALNATPLDVLTGVQTSGTFTLASLDSLGVGALLALMARSGYLSPTTRRRLGRSLLPVGGASLVVVSALYAFGIDSTAYFVFKDLLLALVFAWLVGAASRGLRGMAGALLASKPLVYTGKITYGIYVYHFVPPVVFTFICSRLGFVYPEWGLLNFALSSLATFGLATLSWHFIEQPINNLKRHFPYRSPAAAPIPVGAAPPARPAPLIVSPYQARADNILADSHSRAAGDR